MVKNLDWYIFSPESLQYVLKLENVAKAFLSLMFIVFHNYMCVLSYVKAYIVIVGS